jgi:hypothetical protein
MMGRPAKAVPSANGCMRYPLNETAASTSQPNSGTFWHQNTIG